MHQVPPGPPLGDNAERSLRAAADHLQQLVALEEDPIACQLVREVGDELLGRDYEIVWVALMKRFQQAGRTKLPIGGLREYAQAIADGEDDWHRGLRG